MSKRRSARFDAYRDFLTADRDEKQRGRITLARQGKPRVFKKERRQHVIDQIVDLMRDWRSTPFALEGTLRHGVRSALCLQGHRWSVSDIAAADVIDASLRILGSERPTWEQGQREYTVPRENCSWCMGPMPDDLLLGGKRRINFCSDVCAKSAMTHRDFEARKIDSEMYLSAKAIVDRLRTPSIQCEWCSRSFYTRHKGIRFCSTECKGKARRTVDERQCAECGEPFRRGGRRQKEIGRYCSVKCYAVARTRMHIVVECEGCGTSFDAKGAKARFCCDECRRTVRKFKAGEPPKRISAPVIDYLFRRQGLRITQERIAA